MARLSPLALLLLSLYPVAALEAQADGHCSPTDWLCWSHGGAALHPPPEIPGYPQLPDIATDDSIDLAVMYGLRDDLAQRYSQPIYRHLEGLLGSLTADSPLRDRHPSGDEPVAGGEWKTEMGPLFVFNQYGAGPAPYAAEERKVNGKTGVGCKLPLAFGAEVQVRGCSAVSYMDRPWSERAGESNELFFEVQCRCPLPGKAGLEYQGAAYPALNTGDHHRINQDVRLALPIGDDAQLRLGAKHQWEDSTTPRPWQAGMQLYVGFEMKLGGIRKQ